MLASHAGSLHDPSGCDEERRRLFPGWVIQLPIADERRVHLEQVRGDPGHDVSRRPARRDEDLGAVAGRRDGATELLSGAHES